MITVVFVSHEVSFLTSVCGGENVVTGVIGMEDDGTSFVEESQSGVSEVSMVVDSSQDVDLTEVVSIVDDSSQDEVLTYVSDVKFSPFSEVSGRHSDATEKPGKANNTAEVKIWAFMFACTIAFCLRFIKALITTTK